VACTLTLARRHHRFPSNSLTPLAASLGVTTGRRAHRAGGDVETTLGVFQALVGHLVGRGCRTLGDLLAAHGPVRPRGGPPDVAALPAPLVQALARGEVVAIRYSDGQLQVTERLVRPIALEHDRLVAWCYLRNAERSFVLARIEDAWAAAEPDPIDDA
jgi:DNA polymerase III epsilon subunit-like protein